MPHLLQGLQETLHEVSPLVVVLIIGLILLFIALSVICRLVPHHLLNTYVYWENDQKASEWRPTDLPTFVYSYISIPLYFGMGIALTFAFLLFAVTPLQVLFSLMVVLIVAVPPFVLLFSFRLTFSTALLAEPSVKQIYLITSLALLCFFGTTLAYCLVWLRNDMLAIRNETSSDIWANNSGGINGTLPEIAMIFNATPFFSGYIVSLIGTLLTSMACFEKLVAHPDDTHKTRTQALLGGLLPFLYFYTFALAVPLVLVTNARTVTPAYQFYALVLYALVGLTHLGYFPHNFISSLNDDYSLKAINRCLFATIYVFVTYLFVGMVCVSLRDYHPEVHPSPLSFILVGLVVLIPQIFGGLLHLLYLTDTRNTDDDKGLWAWSFRTINLMFASYSAIAYILIMLILSLRVNLDHVLVILSCLAYLIGAVALYGTVWYKCCKHLKPNFFSTIVYTRWKWSADVIEDILHLYELEQDNPDVKVPPLDPFFSNHGRFGMSEKDLARHLFRHFLFRLPAKENWEIVRLTFIGLKDLNSGFSVLIEDVLSRILWDLFHLTEWIPQPVMIRLTNQPTEKRRTTIHAEDSPLLVELGDDDDIYTL